MNIGLPVRRADCERARLREESATHVAIHQVRITNGTIFLGLPIGNQVGADQIVV